MRAPRHALSCRRAFTDARARIVDSASTTVGVPADGSETWTAEQEFAAPDGTQSLVRAVSREK